MDTIAGKNNNKIVYGVCTIAALAGLLFGLDIAYVNGSLPLIAKDFNITSTTQQGEVAGLLLIGAAIGALLSGAFSRIFGRKKVLIIAAFIFTFFTLIGVFSPTFNFLLVSRFIVGLAVGIASFVAPLYLSEIAPRKIRGGMIAMYQFMITVGIFLMFLSNSLLERFGSWRIMLFVLVVPSLVMLIGCLLLPKSPRWLMLRGKNEEAKEVLRKIRNSEDEVDYEINEIAKTTKVKSSGFEMLKNKFFLKVLLLGVLLQAFQQFTGMNAFMYYSTQIFQQAGFSNPTVATVSIGLVNMLTTIIAIKYVDKFGRKPILYAGLTILFISCCVVGYIFKEYYSVEMVKGVAHSAMTLSPLLQWTTLIFCLLFIFGFAVSMGPIIWIICSEIQPLEGRDLGITISTMTNWICNAILGGYAINWLTFHPGNTFLSFGTVCIVCILFVFLYVPETKGISLEEIEMNLRDNKPLKKIGEIRA
jgi:MFS transporter, SP family, galactose:H+ symporter